MKKTVLVLMLGILLIAGNLYAADGDLYVNGDIGVGTESPTAKLDVRGTTYISNTNERLGLNVRNTLDQYGRGIGEFIIGTSLETTLAGASIGQIYGLEAVARLSSTGPTAKRIVGANFLSMIGNPDSQGTTTLDELYALTVGISRHARNAREYTVINSYGLYSNIGQGGTAYTPINITNHHHQYLSDPGTLTQMNITNLTGMWLDKQTAGTNNYGIVLAGDGAGADISFGSSQESKLYGSSGDIMVDTAQGNGLILRATDGPNCFKITVSNASGIQAESVTCP